MKQAIAAPPGKAGGKEKPSGRSRSSPVAGTLEKDILTGKEVQDLLGISRTTLWKLRKKQGFPYSKVGREYRYLKSDVIAWLQDSKYRESQMILDLRK